MTNTIQIWNEETARKELSDRLKRAREARKPWENRWQLVEIMLYNMRGNSPELPSIDGNWDANYDGSPLGGNGQDAEGTLPNVGSNYIMKNHRAIHSQFSANPPVVAPRPLSPDEQDHRRASIADAAVRYGMRRYKMQNGKDLLTWDASGYGTGWGKTEWDAQLGEVSGFDPQTQQVTLSGDFRFSTRSVWNMFPDPDATTFDGVKWVFEEILIPYEEACYRFQDKKEEIDALLKDQESKAEKTGYSPMGAGADSKPSWSKTVRCYQYWEKGLPWNGMQGRFVWCLEDGTPLSDPSKQSPYRFQKRLSKREEKLQTEGKLPKEMPKQALLPYHLLTDIDVPGTYWGVSTIMYAAAGQQTLNSIDNVILDAARASSLFKWFVPESSNVDVSTLSDNPGDVVRHADSFKPTFQAAPEMPNYIFNIREQHKQGIDDVMGVNESMFGQQSREQATSAMQYAVQQGTMLRRRFFNKFTDVVESIYWHYLMIVQEHWPEDRQIEVVGEERAFDLIDFNRADLLGGYDLVVEYGTTFSLDPSIRRQEVMTMMPLFEKAGVPFATILRFAKFGELENLHDRLNLSKRRVMEDIKQMSEKPTEGPITPRPHMDYPAMLNDALQYVMTAEFKYKPEETRNVINAYIDSLTELAKTMALPEAPANAVGAEGAADVALPMGAMPVPA